MACFMRGLACASVLCLPGIVACKKDASTGAVTHADAAAPPPAISSTAAVAAGTPSAAAAGTPSAAASVAAGGSCNEDKPKDCEDKCFAGSWPSCDAAWVKIYRRKHAGGADDAALRLRLARKACELGMCARLARHYDNGSAVAKDPKRALELDDKACEQGVPTSCFFAADSYQCESPADQERMLRKGCALGHEESCKRVRHLEYSICYPATIADLVAAPSKWIGKMVGLKNVAVRRTSPTSGLVGPPGGSILDSLSAIVKDEEDVRRQWFAIPAARGAGVPVSLVEAVVEEQMARDARVRLVIIGVHR